MIVNETGPETDDDIASLRSENARLEASLRSVRAEADQRLIHAELRAEALKAGMIDLDGLRLLDSAAVTVDEAGEVHGAAGAMTRMRRDKPWLFTPQNSTSVAGVPKHSAVRDKLATEMTLDEWRTARADLLRRK
jgi:hypothetical protein